METNYVLSDKSKKLVQEHLKALFTPQEELILTIAESFNCSHADAEKYAKKLRFMALQDYNSAFRSKGNAKI